MRTFELILSCTCNSQFQDGKYGPGRRVHNQAQKGKAWRCTVCSKERSDAGEVISKKK